MKPSLLEVVVRVKGESALKHRAGDPTTANAPLKKGGTDVQAGPPSAREDGALPPYPKGSPELGCAKERCLFEQRDAERPPVSVSRSLLSRRS